MSIELTTASAETINSIRESLSAAETSRLEAPKSDSRSINNDGVGEFNTSVTFQSSEGEGPEGTLGKIVVTFPLTDGLYERQLLRRLYRKFDGNNDFPYNYSNIKLTINSAEGEIVANVVGINWPGQEIFEIYVDQAPNADPYTVTYINFDYDFVNTVGLDVPNNIYGMATDDNDIDIISGRDIDLRAADDIYISAGSNFVLEHDRLDGQNEEEGIEFITNNANNQHTWTFDFEGKLRLPGNNAQIAVEDYGVRIGNGNVNTAPSNHIKVGGDYAFEVFGGPPGYSYKFDRKNTLTLPPSGTLSADGGVYNGGHLQWFGGASGDGNGYTTLELHPDSSRTEHDQYIIIDPTAPNHIHIRAGGEQDNAGAELILGGENSHFAVSAGSNPSIRAVANGNTWTFENNGYLYFPDGGALKIKGSAPGTSIGTNGDVPGMIAFDNDYLYQCVAPWDGITNIWKRVQFSASTW